MAQVATVVIHFKDLDSDEEVRDAIEKRCEHLAEEFHEVTRFEVTLSEDGVNFTADGHVTGKGTDVATHARGNHPGTAGDHLLDKVERQLRRIHDKRIFAQRRDAQREPPKRTQSG